MFADPLTDRLARFVREIGVDVQAAALDGPTFLPGLSIRCGALLIDEAQLSYPGDILHEAGHIAVTAPEERSNPEIEPTQGDEIATIAWSYAAALHLGIDPAIVFHQGGYRGSSPAFLENFAAGRFVGVPLLQYYGMTIEPPTPRRPIPAGATPYPHMLRWMR